MARIELKNFEMISVTIISAVLGAIWGLIIGGLVAILGGVQISGFLPIEAGILATGVMVLIFAVGGLIIGAVSAFFYNIVSMFLGGIVIEIDFRESEM